jgi:AbrB family looped-hinge helix DNA binding protein
MSSILDAAIVRPNLTNMKTVVSTKGQIIIPIELRTEDSISPGDSFEIQKVRSGEYLIRRVREAPNKGLTDWLLSCPVKGYFQPVLSESTDAL